MMSGRISSSHHSEKRIDLTRLRWRFVICIASFYVNAIAWGFISSTGIFEDAFQTMFSSSSFKSALPGSIQIATMSIFSVLASVLTLRFGVRWITVSGALIATIGFVFAAILSRYWSFCLFYGFFVGFGEALMLVPAILAIPPYFPASHVSLATASAVSGASLGMFGIPFLLKYLLDTYGLRGATLLASCLWLSVTLAGVLFGQGVTSIVEENLSIMLDETISPKIDDKPEQLIPIERRLIESTSGYIFSRRTSLFPAPTHYHQQDQSRVLSIDGHNRRILTTTDEVSCLSHREMFNSIHSSSMMIQSMGIQTESSEHQYQSNSMKVSKMIDSIALQTSKDVDHSNEEGKRTKRKCFSCRVMIDIGSLFHLNLFRLLILSMIFIWSFDETNFLFLTDLLKSSGQSEERSTLLIALTGVADLIGQLFFGYLGDVEYFDPFLLWTIASIIAGLALSLLPLMASHGIVSLSIAFFIHAFFLAAPNALGNVIMIDVVGMHRYALAYGFSLLVSGSASLFGYPLLGFLKDQTHSWTIPFALVGVIMIIGGLIIGTIPLYRCYQKQKN